MPDMLSTFSAGDKISHSKSKQYIIVYITAAVTYKLRSHFWSGNECVK